MRSNPRDLLAGVALRRFEQYPEFKVSGIGWLGGIPAGWRTVPLKRLASIRYGLGEPPRELPSGLPFIRATNIARGSITTDALISVDPTDVPWKRDPTLRTNDIIVVRSGAYTGDSAMVPSRYDGAIAGYDMVVRPHAVYPGFLAWTLLSRYVLDAQIRIQSERAAQPHLNAEELGQVVILLPSSDEQRRVAGFLDRETARIDALVAKKKRLVDLLNEQRASLITRAVTKGLDSNVAMKDSGVRWLGRIPAGWDCERIKWVARMESGHTPDKKIEAYWIDGNIPWVSLADTALLRQTDYVTDTAVRTTIQGIEHSSARILPSGTVVFSRDATIGLCAITAVPMAVSQHFIGWVCGERLRPEYLLFVLRSMTQELDRLTMGATVKTIGMADVKALVTPIPPCEEQERIVTLVLEERSRIDTLLAKVQDVLDRLGEYRLALISEAVTGRIDVREEVA